MSTSTTIPVPRHRPIQQGHQFLAASKGCARKLIVVPAAHDDREALAQVTPGSKSRRRGERSQRFTDDCGIVRACNSVTSSDDESTLMVVSSCRYALRPRFGVWMGIAFDSC